MLIAREVSAYRQFPSGAWIVAAIVGQYRVQRTYFGYSKREAVRAFLAEVAR